MIKLFKGVVQQLLLILLYLQEKGFTMRDVHVWMRDEWGGRANAARNPLQTKEIHAQVYEILTAYEKGAELETIPSLTNHLSTTLRSKGKHPSDLIDSLVGVVMSPWGRNVLSGSGLASLRRALLLPEEASGLVERLKKKELSCGHCGNTLIMGEATTLNFDGRDGSILCYNCAVPSYFRCQSCDGHAVVPNKLRESFHSKMRTCENCKNPKPKQEEKVEEAANQPPDVQEAVRGIRLVEPMAIPRGYAEFRHWAHNAAGRVEAPWNVDPGPPPPPPQLVEIEED